MDYRYRLLWLAALPALASTAFAQAQPSREQGAAAAISEAVQEGSNPYRPPSAPTPDANATPEEARRAKCRALMDEYNATPGQRAYTSPGTATQNAQGRAVPKIERDQARKNIEQTYRENCT